MAKLTEVSLDGLLRISSIPESRQYTVLADPREREMPHIVTRVITAFAETAKGQYVLRKALYLKTNGDDKVGIDSDNDPYFVINYGDAEFNLYCSTFLRNGGFASAMGQLHERQLDKIYDFAKKSKHKIITQFEKDISDFILRVPQIQDKLQRAYFKGTHKEEYDSLQKIDRWLYNALERQYSGDKPKRIENPKELAKANKDKLWRSWYREQIDDERYNQKLDENRALNKAAFADYVASITDLLEAREFVKVQKIEGL